MRKRNARSLAIRLALAIAVIAGVYYWASAGKTVLYSSNVQAKQLLSYEARDGRLPYAKLMLEHPEAFENKSATAIVHLDPAAYTAAAPEAALRAGSGEERQTLNWDNERGWVEWTFQSPSAGWYELEVEYQPREGGNSSVIRGVQIDGRYPFVEAERIELERRWKDSKFPYDRNEIGQQIRPSQEEIRGWFTKRADSFSASSEPLLFRLEQGEHTLRLVGVKEGVSLRQLAFHPRNQLADYESYKASHPENGAAPDWFQVIEAEQFKQKSSLSIQTDYWSEPNISPDPKGRITYNVLGGNRWRLPGEWVEWEFSVPNSGWYELDLKAFQNYRNGFYAYRTIEIDGAVPYREMFHYGVDDMKEFDIVPIADDEGVPYRYYLEEGKHTLRMTADSSTVQPLFLALKATLEDLADFDRHLRLLTGNYSKSAFDSNTDSTRTWNMLRLEPDIHAKIESFIHRLREIQDYMNGMNRKNSDLSQAINSSVALLEKMLVDVDEIPNKINDFSTIQNNIGTWMATLTQQPLLLDYIVVKTPGTQTGLKTATWVSRIPYSFNEFANSFILDYDVRKHNRKEALTVWVQRGRDYVELLREMVDQDFTPRTGIEVNINLMTNPNILILGNAAGEVPDVALGIAEASPADFAMRGAVEDLSGYPDFEEVFNRFIPGVRRAVTYDNGVYGLPEVQNFQMLFYRTDILEQLGLQVPQTWDDMFTILPTLQENGMTINFPKGDFSTLFFQQGAEFYSQDGMKSNLMSEGGQQAFNRWVNLFRKYNLPIDIPAFFQHFRDGDIPIGVADFNTYVQLLVAAPEITGHWKMAPLPGVKNSSGEVERWSPQGITGAMVMKKSERKNEAWEFLKWWTSDEVQSQYAKDIESFYGIEFRWNTANVNAMGSLAWPSEDLKAIQEQMRWAKNAPYIPGYYFLGREMEFAWNRSVFDGIPPLESLEQADLSLQREMIRKQNDFGVKGKNLNIPQIDRPYEWEDAAK
ncbi:extracellular solute-binding protein [Paenibacillus sp. GCM10012307]|uniref:Extracellular solute-binding protein n=1 Tax=Paenibacillus roseus TaxID=2798579 RepID=A0A934MPM7_9BACL|nr:extracellular solute-binding protein [Paenibacillus roseus]MBJ6362246.1 extracellular solute-binding protein [Paenibacillus roseus]